MAASSLELADPSNVEGELHAAPHRGFLLRTRQQERLTPGFRRTGPCVGQARNRGRPRYRIHFLRLDSQTFQARCVRAMTTCHQADCFPAVMRPQTRLPKALRDDSEGEGKGLPMRLVTRRVGLP